MFQGRIRPTATGLIFDKAENTMPANDERRLTDVALGVIEPLWATDSYGTNDAGAGTFRTIRTFDGSEGLAGTDITLQARLLTTSLTGLPTSLLYDIDVADTEKSGSYRSPVILPGLIDAGLVNSARTITPFESDVALRTFLIPGNDPEMEDGRTLEFQFRVGPLNAATVTDPDDPRTLLPWSFDIATGFIAQRANVTILNNVIYPENGESTVLNYELERPGMVSVIVFGLDGSVIRTIHRGRQGNGTYQYAWDGRNNSGDIVARGIYFIRVVAPGVDEYRKVLVAKD